MISTEISPDVAALVDALTGVSPGSSIGYKDLSAAIGRDIIPVRYLLHSALRIAARDHGAVFSNERGTGYTRLTPDKLPSVGFTARARIRRRARGAAKLMRYGSDRANDMPPETQRKLNAELSALALIEHVSTDKAAEPVEVHSQRPEPVAITAQRLFRAA